MVTFVPGNGGLQMCKDIPQLGLLYWLLALPGVHFRHRENSPEAVLLL